MDANSFTPLQTYKVLKHKDGNNELYECFTPLQTYKVLKPKVSVSTLIIVLHHYKLTRFSNSQTVLSAITCVLHHYKLTRFSNPTSEIKLCREFYTITNLQGSQTLHTALIQGHGSFTPLQTYKVLKLSCNR